MRVGEGRLVFPYSQFETGLLRLIFSANSYKEVEERLDHYLGRFLDLVPTWPLPYATEQEARIGQKMGLLLQLANETRVTTQPNAQKAHLVRLKLGHRHF